MDFSRARALTVQEHYKRHIYPELPLFASIRGYDAYALNAQALAAHFYGQNLNPKDGRILLAGCGSFSPYPTALANPQARIIALDFSASNLRRARWHSGLHGCFNIEFVNGDLLNAIDLFGEKVFHFIDCYGVIHHIREDIRAGKILHDLLKPKGFVRIMLYSYGARRCVASATRAFQLLGITNVQQIKRIYQRAPLGSRLRNCLDNSPDAQFNSGLADLFLHPYAKMYRIDELLELLEKSGLVPLQFIHQRALTDVSSEIIRLRDLEQSRALNSNFILFAGRIEDEDQQQHWQMMQARYEEAQIFLNPVLKRFLPHLALRPVQPAPRLGFANPIIDFAGKRLLDQFKQPKTWKAIDQQQRHQIAIYRKALFLSGII